MPMFYGGRINSKGSFVSTPYAGTTARTLARIEKLVRIDHARALGVPMSDMEIGRLMGCSTYMVRSYRNKPEYLQLRHESLTGLPASAATSVETIIAARKQALKDMLPQALRVVAEALTNPLTNQALKTKIALEVLDREGSFPKISRTDIHAKVEHDYKEQDQVSAELLGYMEAPSNTISPDLQRVLDANKKFANSESISAQDQEAALAALEAIKPTTEVIQ